MKHQKLVALSFAENLRVFYDRASAKLPPERLFKITFLCFLECAKASEQLWLELQLLEITSEHQYILWRVTEILCLVFGFFCLKLFLEKRFQLFSSSVSFSCMFHLYIIRVTHSPGSSTEKASGVPTLFYIP